jgi:hypothetical protein
MVVYLNESLSSDINDTLSQTAVFYEHMLKWKHWENLHYGQDRSWPGSIFRSIKNIITFKISKNIKGGINADLYRKGYLVGVKKASKRKNDKGEIITINIKKMDSDQLFKTDGFNTLDKILDMEFVKAWLIKEAKSDKAEEYVIEKYNNYKKQLEEEGY